MKLIFGFLCKHGMIYNQDMARFAGLLWSDFIDKNRFWCYNIFCIKLLIYGNESYENE
jgi:hypothetical protein